VTTILKYKPVGALSQIIIDYIGFKRLHGLKYAIEENVLYRFSVFTQDYSIEGSDIPQAILIDWFRRRPNEKASTLKNRCAVVSGMMFYAKDHGYKVNIPEIPKMRIENYSPYIFTEYEINKFFHACDILPAYSGSRRHEIVL